MAKIMKNILKKLVRDEGGQAFILVLVFLLVGGLILTPLLGYMGTGVKAGQMHEAKMELLYAADAGIEDALYKIMNNDALLPENLGDSWTLDPIVVNGKDVTVEIVLEETINEFLENLLGGDAGVHEEWTTVIDEELPAGQYTVTVTYTGAAANKKIDGMGAWFRGDYEYVASSASGIPVDYPNYEPFPFETQEFRGGTAFIWRWTAADRPVFQPDPPNNTRTLTFEYDPENVPVLYVGWVEVGSADVGTVPTGVTFGTYKVIATATDSATGEQTVVVAYPSWQSSGGLNTVDILAWEINP